MASFTPRGYQKDESFWEVGLHLGLQLLFAFLAEDLAELARVKDHLPVMFGMVIGIGVGNRLVGWARGRLHLTSRAQNEPPAMPPFYSVLPIAFPIAIGSTAC